MLATLCTQAYTVLAIGPGSTPGGRSPFCTSLLTRVDRAVTSVRSRALGRMPTRSGAICGPVSPHRPLQLEHIDSSVRQSRGAGMCALQSTMSAKTPTVAHTSVPPRARFAAPRGHIFVLLYDSRAERRSVSRVGAVLPARVVLPLSGRRNGTPQLYTRRNAIGPSAPVACLPQSDTRNARRSS